MTLETEGDTPPKKIEIDVSLQDPEWEKIPNIENIVRIVALKALNNAIMPKFAYDRSLEVSMVLANDDLVQILNREYRDKDKPTNVLTFASLDSDEAEIELQADPLNLGDVILSYQTIKTEAKEQGKFLMDHLKHLIVHGVLHLLGYDHQDDEAANDMETLEIRILEQLDVQNPYIESSF